LCCPVAPLPVAAEDHYSQKLLLRPEPHLHSTVLGYQIAQADCLPAQKLLVQNTQTRLLICYLLIEPESETGVCSEDHNSGRFGSLSVASSRWRKQSKIHLRG